VRDDDDSPWKEVLERYFPTFLAWFFPVAHADIAWEHGYRFLDKELQKVVRDAKLGRHWADKLVQVVTRDGGEDWLLVHVEVQEQRETDFARRMFSYNYRLFDRYARPVVSLAVLGEGRGETVGRFGYGRWGGETRFTFPVVKVCTGAAGCDRIFWNCSGSSTGCCNCRLSWRISSGQKCRW
jgi:hypothetical protein